jgi:hypothetical protein
MLSSEPSEVHEPQYNFDTANGVAVYLECLDDDGWQDCPVCREQIDVEVLRPRVLLVECRRGHHVVDHVRRFLPRTSVTLLARLTIRVGYAQLAQVSRALHAISRVQREEPEIFQMSGKLVSVRYGRIEDVSSMALRLLLGDVAIWTDESGRPVDPPARLAHAILQLRSYAGIPSLAGVITVPTMGSDGEFRIRPGYDAETQMYYSPAPDLDGLAVPARVGSADLEAAKRLILDDLLGDFPFVAESDVANALSIGITPFVRTLIKGPTPLHWVGAPEPGTGKGKLVDSLLAGPCGVVPSQPLPESEGDRRKTITALMRSGAVAIKLDNAKGTVRSSALELGLTELWWTDRILGVSANVDAPILAVWTLTANNATPGTDLKRRAIPIRLDAGHEQPYRRSGPGPGQSWRHPLPAWAQEHRAELVTAFLVILRWWVQAGRPLATSGRMGSYEAWEATIGGILEAADVDGFLGNLDDFDATDDEERDELAEFLSRWERLYGQAAVTAREVVDDGRLEAACGTEVGPQGGRWTVAGLATYLRGRKGRVVAGRRLAIERRRSAANAWRLESIG